VQSLYGVSAVDVFLKPTAKFYGTDDRRHVTVLEHERAQLPLRLTGDGVSQDYFAQMLWN
jgi:nucleoporin POM152